MNLEEKAQNEIENLRRQTLLAKTFRGVGNETLKNAALAVYLGDKEAAKRMSDYADEEQNGIGGELGGWGVDTVRNGALLNAMGTIAASLNPTTRDYMIAHPDIWNKVAIPTADAVLTEAFEQGKAAVSGTKRTLQDSIDDLKASGLAALVDLPFKIDKAKNSFAVYSADKKAISKGLKNTAKFAAYENKGNLGNGPQDTIPDVYNISDEDVDAYSKMLDKEEFNRWISEQF